MLRITNLTKSYDNVSNAIDSVSLEINPGEIFAFIGPNGAGKTTTIKCVVGLIDFKQGDVLIKGMPIKDKPIECKRIMAYIPDDPMLYEALTGLQYLNFIADVYQISTEARNEDIKKYADMFEITSNLGDLISSYSHGMKQKVALISALIRHPKLLILDEPFVGLDPKASHTIKELMRNMCDEGAAVFFSTHVLEVAEKLCDKVAIIKNGNIVVTGSMEDVKGDQSLEDVFLELVE